MTSQEAIDQILTDPDAFPNSSELETSDAVAAIARMVGAKRVLEFGTYMGLTTLKLAQAVGDHGEVVTVDVKDFTKKRILMSDVSGRVTQIIGSSESVRIEGNIDFLFVDSDHSGEHVMKEVMNVWRNLVPDAVICFHDCYTYDGVWSVVNSLERTGMIKSVKLRTLEKKGWMFINGLVVAVKCSQ